MTRRRRRAFAPTLLCLLALASLGSCKFLSDEFVWLDRAGPVVERPDAPVEGVSLRP